MSGALRLDAKFQTIEQEAPHVANPLRAVEIFSQDNRVYLRVGPVEGVNPVHGSYTVMLSAHDALEIASALRDVSSNLATDPRPALLSPPPRTHHNTW